MMKLTALIGGFLIAHGIVHPLLMIPPAEPNGPLGTWFLNPDRACLLNALGLPAATSRHIGIALIAIALVGYLVAGIGYFGTADWWRPAAAVASGASLLVLLLFWHPWMWVGAILDVIIMLAAILRLAPARI